MVRHVDFASSIHFNCFPIQLWQCDLPKYVMRISNSTSNLYFLRSWKCQHLPNHLIPGIPVLCTYLLPTYQITGFECLTVRFIRKCDFLIFLKFKNFIILPSQYILAVFSIPIQLWQCNFWSCHWIRYDYEEN